MRKNLTISKLTLFTVAFFVIQSTILQAQNSVFAYAKFSSSEVSKQKILKSNFSAPEESQTLQKALTKLNKIRGIYFLVTDQTIVTKPVNEIDLKKVDRENVQQILDNLLINTGLEYKKINDKTFLIQKTKLPNTKTNVYNEPAMLQLTRINEQELVTPPVIKGRVAAADGTPLAGASVIIKGTSKGTTTGVNGDFTLNAESSDILVISYIGYETQEISVGSSTSITISMAASKIALNDVIVTTALGFQKKAKNLGYVAQQVSNADLTTVKEANFSSSLAGKAANVTITQGSGGAGSATNIILRGNNSLSGNGSPLIVIDGIPAVNENARPTTGQGQYGQNFLAPDQLSTINPNDVEEVTILKGAVAAALYGSQAANGAILITTKSGKDGQTRVSLSTNTTFLSALYQPKLQTEYGGASGDNGSFSWGAKDPNAAYAGSFYKDLLQTGLNSSNTIDVSTGTKNTQLFATYANTNSKGIIPNNSLRRNNFDLKGTANMFNNFIEFTGKLSYVDQTIYNPYAPGQYLNPYYTFMTIPANTDMSKYSNRGNLVLNVSPYQNWAYDAGSTNTDNPYWDVYKVLTTDKLNRLILSGNVKFNFTSYLNLMLRGNMDQTNEQYENDMYQGTWTALAATTGGFTSTNTFTKQNYGDAILNFNKAISNNLQLTALAGAAIRDYKQTGTTINSNRVDMYQPNMFITSNVDFTKGGVASDIYGRKQTQSAFYSFELGYKNALFLTTTGRNDWSSTLTQLDITNNKISKPSYFYPSVGISAVLTDLVKGLSSKTMNYLKLRAGYTQVGNDLSAFITNPVSTLVGSALIPPTTIVKPGTILKPEMTSSFEAGFDVAFLNNLIRLEATYYKSNTKNQLFTVVGNAQYANFYVNGGNIENHGIELSLSATPTIGQVKWTSTVNFSKNVNTVKSLITEKPYLIYSQLNNSTSYFQKIIPGGSLGDFYAKRFQRNTDGTFKLNSYYINGVQQNGTTPLLEDQPERIGNAFPDFLLSWGNKFNYKNFRFSFLVDGRFGGKIIPMSEVALDNAGNSVQSAQDRDNGYVLINGQKATDVKGFYQLKAGIGGALGEYAYSSTAVRLREVSLLYNIPAKLLAPAKFIKGASIGLIGRNLFFFYKAAPIDPEIVSNNAMGQNAFLGLEFYNLPSTRNIGFSVNVNF
jgi:TonB-linked outer membrane protein, SusC/RagA family